MRDHKALDSIRDTLSASEWNADTVSAVADIVRATGRSIHDIDAPPSSPSEWPNAAIVVPAFVTLDDPACPAFPCMLQEGDTWNGWERPQFGYETMKRVIAWLSADGRFNVEETFDDEWTVNAGEDTEDRITLHSDAGRVWYEWEGFCWSRCDAEGN